MENNPCPAPLKVVNLAGAANPIWQQLRPEDPQDVDFRLQEDAFLPGFFKSEVQVRGNDISSSPQTNNSNSKTWYTDCTFKIVSQAFKQLLTINAFVKSGEPMKQGPIGICGQWSRQDNRLQEGKCV